MITEQDMEEKVWKIARANNGRLTQKQRKHALAQIAKKINSNDKYIACAADADRNNPDYLLYVGRNNGDSVDLVVMYDYGITWEPCRAYPTPCYHVIDLTNIKRSVLEIQLVIDLWSDKKLVPMEPFTYPVVPFRRKA